MEKICCKSCGSGELILQDDIYVCSFCGTKYTKEQAQKMVIEGTVSVKVDKSEELLTLFQTARNHVKSSNYETAITIYEKISTIDPNSWEALFYSIFLKTLKITNGEITSTAVTIINCIPVILDLISKIENEDEKKNALQEVVSNCKNRAITLTEGSHSFYKSVARVNNIGYIGGIGSKLNSFVQGGGYLVENRERCCKISNIVLVLGNTIESKFDMEDETYKNLAVICWKQFINFFDDYKKRYNSKIYDQKYYLEYQAKINRYLGIEENNNFQNENNTNQTPSKAKEILALIGFILGIPSLIFSGMGLIFGYLTILSLELSGAGLVLSIIGKNCEKNKDKAKIGLIFNIVSLVFSFIGLIIFFTTM